MVSPSVGIIDGRVVIDGRDFGRIGSAPEATTRFVDGGFEVTSPAGTITLGGGGVTSVTRGGGSSGRRRRPTGKSQAQIDAERRASQEKLRLETLRLAQIEAERQRTALELFQASPVGSRQLAQEQQRVGDPLQIQSFTEEDRQRQLREKGGAFVRDIPSAVFSGTKKFFTEGVFGIGDVSPGATAFGEEIALSEGLKKDVTFSDHNIRIPLFGTVTSEHPTGIKTITFGQRQANIERDRNFKILLATERAKTSQSKFDIDLQKKIDDEKITFDEAIKMQQGNVRNVNKKLQSDVENIFKKSPPDVVGLTERKQTVRNAVDLALNTAAIGGGFISPFVPLVFFGTMAAIKSPTAVTVPEKIEVGLDVAFAAGGLGGVVGKAGQAAFLSSTEVAIKEVAAQKTFSKSIGVRLTDKEISQFSIGIQKGESGKIVSQSGIVLQFDKTGKIISKGGDILRTTTVQPTFRTIPFKGPQQKFVTIVERGKIGVKGKAKPITKVLDTVEDIGKPTDFTKVTGITTFEKVGEKGAVSEFDITTRQFKAISKFGKKDTLGIKDIDFFTGITRKQEKGTFKTFSATTRFDIKTGKELPIQIKDIRQSDVIKILDQKAFNKLLGVETPTATFVKPTKIKKTPFSTTFGQGIDITKTTGMKASKISKKPLKPVTKIEKKTAQEITPIAISSRFKGFAPAEEAVSGIFSEGLTKTIPLASTSFGVKSVTPIVTIGQIEIFKPKFAQTQQLKTGQQSQLKLLLEQQTKQRTKLKTVLQLQSKQQSQLQTELTQETALEQQLALKTSLKQQSVLITELQLQTQFVQPVISTTQTTHPTIRTGFKPGIGLPPPVLFLPKKQKRFISKVPTSKPYNVFVRTGGIRKQVAKGLTKNQARDFGAFVTDNSLSAEFKIKKVSGKIKQPSVQISKDYYAINQTKFRTFKIRKGKKIPLKNTFIEIKQNRLDTIGEVNKITATRLIAQQPRRKMSARNLQNIFGMTQTKVKKVKKSKKR